MEWIDPRAKGISNAVQWPDGERASAGRLVYQGDPRCGCRRTFRVVEVDRPVVVADRFYTAFTVAGVPHALVEEIGRRLEALLGPDARSYVGASRAPDGMALVVVPRGEGPRARLMVMRALDHDAVIRRGLAGSLRTAEREEVVQRQLRRFEQRVPFVGARALWQFGVVTVYEHRGRLGWHLVLRCYDEGGAVKLGRALADRLPWSVWRTDRNDTAASPRGREIARTEGCVVIRLTCLGFAGGALRKSVGEALARTLLVCATEQTLPTMAPVAARMGVAR